MTEQLPSRRQRARLTRRAFLSAAGLAAAGLAVSSCQAQTSASLPPTASPPPQQTATLEVLPSATAAQPVPAEAVLGQGKGIHPGRVSWAHDPAAAKWDGKSGFWWEPQNTDAGAVAEMLSQALQKQTGETTDASAWEALFAAFNARRGQSQAGYQPGQRVAIKINVNNCDRHAYAANGSFDNPALVLALLQGLVRQGKVPAAAITVYDAIRCIPDSIYDLCATGELSGVHFVDRAGGAGREQAVRDTSVTVRWSADVHGAVTNLPTCLTQADYLINLAGLKGHNLAGVTLTAKNHFGSILANWQGQTLNAPQGANIHGTVAAHEYNAGPEWKWPQRPMGTYTALVDLIAHPHLGGKTLLYLVDGLYPAVHQQAEVTAATSRWQSAPFNGSWTSSMLLSEDPLAIDSVAYDLLSNEPHILAQPDVLPPGHTAQNYLHEAAQAGQPPSGTNYGASGSLGVHEHWDNAQDKRYSRDRGAAEGIELVKIA